MKKGNGGGYDKNTKNKTRDAASKREGRVERRCQEKREKKLAYRGVWGKWGGRPSGQRTEAIRNQISGSMGRPFRRGGGRTLGKPGGLPGNSARGSRKHNS